MGSHVYMYIASEIYCDGLSVSSRRILDEDLGQSSQKDMCTEILITCTKVRFLARPAQNNLRTLELLSKGVTRKCHNNSAQVLVKFCLSVFEY